MGIVACKELPVNVLHIPVLSFSMGKQAQISGNLVVFVQALVGGQIETVAPVGYVVHHAQFGFMVGRSQQHDG